MSLTLRVALYLHHGGAWSGEVPEKRIDVTVGQRHGSFRWVQLGRLEVFFGIYSCSLEAHSSEDLVSATRGSKETFLP